MKELNILYKKHKEVFAPLFLIVAIGLFTNFIVVAVVLCIVFVTISESIKLEVLFILFVTIFFLGDKFSGRLSYNQNLRFVILGLSLVYLYRYNVFSNVLANKILPFTVIAFIVSSLFSPLGLSSVSRALSFWLIAVTCFGYVSVLNKKGKKTLELLVLIIAFYFGVTLFLKFFPLINVTHSTGRFSGLMGNPNGLGLISVFCYGVIDLIKHKKEVDISNKLFNRLKILVVILILLTGSRTAFFSIIIYEVVVRMSKNIVLMFFTLLVLGFSYIFIMSVGFEAILQVLGLSEYMRLDTLESASGRTDAWEVAWEEIKRSPWFGKGILYDSHYIQSYARIHFGDVWDRQWNGVWSSYLSLLLDVGVIGTLAYFSFVYQMFKKAKYKNLAMGFIAMSAFSGITESWMAASMNAFTPVFFLCWALQAQPKIENKEI